MYNALKIKMLQPIIIIIATAFSISIFADPSSEAYKKALSELRKAEIAAHAKRDRSPWN